MDEVPPVVDEPSMDEVPPLVVSTELVVPPVFEGLLSLDVPPRPLEVPPVAARVLVLSVPPLDDAGRLLLPPLDGLNVPLVLVVPPVPLVPSLLLSLQPNTQVEPRQINQASDDTNLTGFMGTP
jgi:hypothetical protein